MSVLDLCGIFLAGFCARLLSELAMDQIRLRRDMRHARAVAAAYQELADRLEQPGQVVRN
jgi:hypothetical protein